MEDRINAGDNLAATDETKPCLVQTAQGFTVSYKQKLLYSKYAPQKAILNLIQNLDILPQTVILCVSPVLSYGLKELSEKLPQDCLMLGCEYEPELYSFITTQNQQDFSELKNFSFLTQEELLELGPLLSTRNVVLKSGFALPQPGTFRRIIKIDFSAGAQFSGQLYDKVLENATNALMTFWTNRVTLVKFGRKYSTNFFKNLAYSQKTVPIQNYFSKIEKPIFVFGAGESAAQGIELLKQKEKNGDNLKESFFILCADTALQPLISQGIIPDGVFIEEAQNVISKCFIGTQTSDIHIFAGLSSLHSITRFFKPEQISFFTTEYIQAGFIDRFEKMGILPPKNKPFGSVGITTYYYATVFRKDDSIPIYTYGLDFAYSAGRTHTKGTMADNARFMSNSRIKPDPNYSAAFCEPAFEKSSYDDGVIKMYTTPIMARYDAIMTDLQSTAALRQAQGPQVATQGPQVATQDQQPETSGVPETKTFGVPEPVEGPNKIPIVLQQEAASLQELKSLLTGQKKIAPDKIEQEITKLIQEKEYLYLHFPDGHKFQYNQSFLNRIRVEVDYFLKIMN